MDAKEYANKFCQAIIDELPAYALELFKENNRIAALIEDKAQKTITVAGIVVSAGLAFVKSSSYGSSGSKIALLIGFIFLILSIVSCLKAIKVSPNPNMPELADRLGHVNDLRTLAWFEITSELAARFRNDQLGVWQDVLSSQQETNACKAQALYIGQTLLLAALMINGIVLLQAIT